jgi:acetoacetyl-CoA synthetase
LCLQQDLGAGDVFFWYTTTGWMMWNYLAGGLLAGAAIVTYDGSATHPAPTRCGGWPPPAASPTSAPALRT